jgi:hypothetical protein
MTHPRCVFQLEIFVLKKPYTTWMRHLKTKHVMLEAIAGVCRLSYELLIWCEYSSQCTKERAKYSRVCFEEQVGRKFCVRFVGSVMVYE